MAIKLGVVMDPIESIKIKKDSTFAMLLEAIKRQWEIFYFTQNDLFIKNGEAYGKSKRLKVVDDEKKWFEYAEEKIIALNELNVILMRKDPPFNQEYIYTTYILELAKNVLIINHPQGLRDANEKIFTALFPECCPPTLVTRNVELLKDFFREQKDIVCKPLDSMGGTSIFRLKNDDVNLNVIFELLTHSEKCFAMAQKYIPEIVHGDKRIILIDGEPVPYALARIPSKEDWRGNLVAGAKGIAQPLTEKDKWICEKVSPVLKEKGLYFVGLDVIGDYLTEINVTSPTCIRELDAQCNLNIAEQLMDFVEKKLQSLLT